MSDSKKVQAAKTALDVAHRREYELKSELHKLQSSLAAAREAEALAAGNDDEAKLRKASKAVVDAVESVRVKQLQLDAARKRVSEANGALHEATTDAKSAELDQRFAEGGELVATLNRDLFKANSSIAALLSYLRKYRSDFRSVPGATDRAGIINRVELGLKNNLIRELSAMPLADSRESADLTRIIGELISATKDSLSTQPAPAVAAVESVGVDFIDDALHAASSEVAA